MIERVVGIGRAVVGVLDIDRGRAEKQKPKPLSLDERHRIEGECGQIVEKEDFGREDFGNFCKNMIILARQEGDPKGFSMLRDRRAELEIRFNENGISIFGKPVVTEDPHVVAVKFYQNISYISQKRDYGFFVDKYSDFQPILTTDYRVPVSSSIEFFSWFKGKSESAFPKGSHDVRKEEKVRDKDVQDFCRKVYGIYATDRLGLNFPQH